MRVEVILSIGMHKMCWRALHSGMTFLDLVIFLMALTVDFSPAQAQASRFAWGCMGPQEIASGLRIVGSREPGSDIVELRNSINEIVLTLHAAGPVTEEVIPNVGRNGEDGFMSKRDYKDEDGNKWIYQNLDAHLSFRSTTNPSLVISCFP